MLIWLLCTYLITCLFGYVVHWSLHRPFSGRLNRSHMEHHLVLYSPERFLSKTYRDPGVHNTVWIFAVASIPMLAIPVILGCLGVVSYWLMSAMIVEMLLIGWFHNYVHDASHIEGHWLTRFPHFRKWVEWHYIHHVDMTKNYGIFGFGYDKLFGTFQNRPKGDQR